MARPLAPRLAILLLAALGAAGEGLAGAGEGGAPRPLEPGRVLPSAEAVGEGWEAVEEAPVDPAGDPQLRRWGVRALRTRHYAQRGEPGSSRVCSVEVWVFDRASRARAARAEFSPEGWRVEREGPLLVLARAVTLTLGEPLEPGLFPACHEIAERTQARGARLLREREPAP